MQEPQCVIVRGSDNPAYNRVQVAKRVIGPFRDSSVAVKYGLNRLARTPFWWVEELEAHNPTPQDAC